MVAGSAHTRERGLRSRLVQLAHRQGQQVGGDGLGHAEVEHPGARDRPRLVAQGPGGHDRAQALGHHHLGVVGDPGRGAVLAGHQGAGVDGLALAEQEGVAPALGLGRLQPLQAHGLGGGLVGDGHRRGCPGAGPGAAAGPGSAPPAPAGTAPPAPVNGFQARWMASPLVSRSRVPPAGRGNIRVASPAQDPAVEVHQQAQVPPGGPGLGVVEVGMGIGAGHGSTSRARPLSTSRPRSGDNCGGAPAPHRHRGAMLPPAPAQIQTAPRPGRWPSRGSTSSP